MGNRRGIPKLLPEQQRTCAADAAGADTDPDGNGKRRSENRIKYLADEKAADPKVTGIIANGYPNRGLSELGL